MSAHGLLSTFVDIERNTHLKSAIIHGSLGCAVLAMNSNDWYTPVVSRCFTLLVCIRQR